MALETGTFISDLVAANPPGGDAKSQGDDHIRLLKSTIRATFPNIAGAVNATHTTLNKLGATATPGDVSTDPASTAFVAAAIAGVNAQIALTVFVVTGTSATAVTGGHYVLTNVAATALTFPASPVSGNEIMITVANNLQTNTFDVGAKVVTGAASSASGVITLDQKGTVRLRYIDNTTNWVPL